VVHTEPRPTTGPRAVSGSRTKRAETAPSSPGRSASVPRPPHPQLTLVERAFLSHVMPSVCPISSIMLFADCKDHTLCCTIDLEESSFISRSACTATLTRVVMKSSSPQLIATAKVSPQSCSVGQRPNSQIAHLASISKGLPFNKIFFCNLVHSLFPDASSNCQERHRRRS
jgi:hypothetical protein